MIENKPTQSPEGYDVTILFPVLFLVGIGVVMVYSASSALALKKFGSDYLILKKQKQLHRSTRRENMGNLEEELAILLNKYNRESKSYTPDFILAQYILDCLGAYEKAAHKRDVWWDEEKNEKGINGKEKIGINANKIA